MDSPTLAGLHSADMIAAGENPSTGRWTPYNYSIIDYLRNKPMNEVIYAPPGSNPPCLSSVEDFARMVIVISATGDDPTNYGDVNYLVMLKSYYDGEQFSVPEDLFDLKDDAILALVSCGDKDQTTDNMIINATDYIKSKQNCDDGGWMGS